MITDEATVRSVIDKMQRQVTGVARVDVSRVVDVCEVQRTVCAWSLAGSNYRTSHVAARIAANKNERHIGERGTRLRVENGSKSCSVALQAQRLCRTALPSRRISSPSEQLQRFDQRPAVLLRVPVPQGGQLSSAYVCCTRILLFYILCPFL
jgi:hypothetical protein